MLCFLPSTKKRFTARAVRPPPLKKKSTLPKQGRDDLKVFSKQTSFLVLMLKNVRNHPAPFLGAVLTQLVAWTAGRIDVSDVLYHLATDALLITGMSRPRELGCGNNVVQSRTPRFPSRQLPSRQGCLVVGNVVGGGSLHQPWEAAPYTQPGSSWRPSAC